jgi:ADP-heptose:LPS heptosyltransferase
MMKLLRLLRRPGSSSGGIDRGEILKRSGKILLVKQSERMGNVILLNSAIDALSVSFPETIIDLLLPAAYADLMVPDPRIGRIIKVYKRKYIMRPWRLLALIRKLRKYKYDLAIDCSDVNSHSSTGAIYTLGNDLIFERELSRYTETLHAGDMIPRLLSGVFEMELSGDPFFKAGSKRSRSDRPIIGINCGGRGSKRWPLENFVELGSRLSDRGINVEFILGPDEGGLRTDLGEKLPSNGRLLPLLPIRKLKETISKYSVFVSSDSGPMHLAWTQAVPTIAIFLDSEIDKFKPLGAGSVALDAKSGLDIDRVFNHVWKILSKTEAAGSLRTRP